MQIVSWEDNLHQCQIPRKKRWHFMQTVSCGDSCGDILHEMSTFFFPNFRKKKKEKEKHISKYHFLKFLPSMLSFKYKLYLENWHAV